MPQSRGAIIVAVLTIALVVLGIVYPKAGQRNGPIVTEAPDTTAGGVESLFSERQKNEIRKTVHAYLVENPAVIIEALEGLQARQQQSERQNTRSSISAHADRLYNYKGDPVIGNPDATITVVEFFDYQCPYCKQMADDMLQLVKEDPDLRVVFKEFPVFGAESTLAARAALAADKQGKYAEFHLGVMKLRGAPSETAILRLAASLGLDADRFRRDMNSEDIEATIKENYKLAQDIGVRGTPAFIIGDRLIPGAMNAEDMRALIARTREGS